MNIYDTEVKLWICENEGNAKQLYLQIYILPATIEIIAFFGDLY
jgi:hypothetical protein